MSELELTHSENGRLVELYPGDTIVVRLKENLTTGYRWTLHEVDEQVVELQASAFLPVVDTPVDGGGQRIIRFLAKAAGVSQLHLKLWREWEGNRSVTARYQLLVQVRI
jgi:inhibitor of cysteine peptidase